MIEIINGDAAKNGGKYDMIFTDAPFEMSGAQLNSVFSGFDYDHLLLIASMHQILEFYKVTNLEFSFDMVVSFVKPKKSRNYAQPNYTHSNIVYFKKKEQKSAFDRRLIERQDYYSDEKTNYYPSIFHAPKRDLSYKYQKNQNMINDLLGAFDVTSVCDPFAGSGTTGIAAIEHGISCTLIERDNQAFSIMRQKLELLGVKND